jgi:hypothetical protein
MPPPPKTRDLARSLLDWEAGKSTTSGQTDSATVRVYEKLRRLLCAPVGADSFHALASRALMLAKSESPRLSAVEVTGDGRLHGFSKADLQTNTDQDGDGGVILIAQLLGLFLAFLGEATTLRLIQDLRLQIEDNTESASTAVDATASEADPPVPIKAFEDLLREIDKLRSVGDGIEALANKHPGMETGLVTVAGNIRDIATVLDVFTLIRSKAGGSQEDAPLPQTNGYLN